MTGRNLLGRALLAMLTCTVLAAAGSGVALGSAAGHVTRHAAAAPRWVLQRHFTRAITVAGEGVASYFSGRLVFRGVNQVPAAIARLGFNHVGDEDIDRQGYVFDAYENDHANPTSKLFTITAPSGRVSTYPHPLARGEEFNNSFVTVSPDNRWIVTGEWNTEPRFLLLANPKGRPSGTRIRLAGTIALRPSLYHVQGCDFYDARTLFCATDDAAHSVVKVLLSAPLHAGRNQASAHRLFVPREVSPCPGRGFESEGVDYNAHTGLLTLTMNQPGSCVGTTDVNVYRRVIRR